MYGVTKVGKLVRAKEILGDGIVRCVDIETGHVLDLAESEVNFMQAGIQAKLGIEEFFEKAAVNGFLFGV